MTAKLVVFLFILATTARVSIQGPQDGDVMWIDMPEISAADGQSLTITCPSKNMSMEPSLPVRWWWGNHSLDEPLELKRMEFLCSAPLLKVHPTSGELEVQHARKDLEGELSCAATPSQDRKHWRYNLRVPHKSKCHLDPGRLKLLGYLLLGSMLVVNLCCGLSMLIYVVTTCRCGSCCRKYRGPEYHELVSH